MTSWAIRDIAKLNEQEKVLIRKSWNKLMRDVENNALEIFKMIFERAPEAKEVSTVKTKVASGHEVNTQRSGVPSGSAKGLARPPLLSQLAPKCLE